MQDVVFLVVDDSQTIRSLVKTAVFSQFGSHHIFTAGNGLQAKEILLSRRVDIIISDWEMPKMSGQELLTFVKENDKLKEIPFIMMTTRGGKESVLEAIQNGVSHYVVKPFTTEKLEDAVRRSWISSRKRREARIAGLPKHALRVAVNGQLLDGKVRNISRSGALIAMEYQQALSLFSSAKMHLNMELPDHGLAKVHNLIGRIIRIEAQESQNVNNHGCMMAILFEPEKNEQAVLDKLNFLIDHISASLPKVVEGEAEVVPVH